MSSMSRRDLIPLLRSLWFRCFFISRMTMKHIHLLLRPALEFKRPFGAPSFLHAVAGQLRNEIMSNVFGVADKVVHQ